MLIGGLIGYFVVSVEAIRDRSLVRFARLASYGAVLGLSRRAIGMLFADTSITSSSMLPAPVFRRRIWHAAWLERPGRRHRHERRDRGPFAGEIQLRYARRRHRRLRRRLSVHESSYETFFAQTFHDLPTTYFGNALGLVIMGACIGSLSALVQAVFQPACVKVLRGWQEGREYPLEKLASLLGRDEHADIALFRDMKVEKKHAFINRVGARYFWSTTVPRRRTPWVNDGRARRAGNCRTATASSSGNVLLRFHLRAAANRAAGRRR